MTKETDSQNRPADSTIASRPTYHLFLDETGDHGLTYIDANFPLFLLCGFIISDSDLQALTREIDKMKQKFFGTSYVILHSRDIRKCDGAFQILFDLSIKQAFYKSLNQILAGANYHLICSAVHKEKHIKKYGKSAGDPYSLSLSFILERLIFLIDSISRNTTVKIFVEQRGKKEDRRLLAHFNSIRDSGTYYIRTDRLRKTLISFTFHNKRENVAGLQVADLCAYPIARHILNPEEPSIPFQIIQEKLYKNLKTGSYKGWGLKVFP